MARAWSAVQHTTPPDKAAERKRHQACAKVRQGELSRARQVLTACDLAPGTEATWAALADPARRPPEARTAIDPEVFQHQPSQPVHVTARAIAAPLRSARRGGVPGFSGMRAEHLKFLLQNRAAGAVRHALASFVALCWQAACRARAGTASRPWKHRCCQRRCWLLVLQYVLQLLSRVDLPLVSHHFPLVAKLDVHVVCCLQLQNARFGTRSLMASRSARACAGTGGEAQERRAVSHHGNALIRSPLGGECAPDSRISASEALVSAVGSDDATVLAPQARPHVHHSYLTDMSIEKLPRSRGPGPRCRDRGDRRSVAAQHNDWSPAVAL